MSMPKPIARFELHRLLVDDLAAERVRGEVLHRDGVVALDEQEVVDADDVLVRDLARVAQLVHEALHHLFVFRDVRVQELEDQPLVDDRVFHQQHGAEGAAADAVDVLVAALDDVAGLERRDVELRGPAIFSACFDRTLYVLLGHQQRAARAAAARRRDACGGADRGGARRRRAIAGACVALGRAAGVDAGCRSIPVDESRLPAAEKRDRARPGAQRGLREGLVGCCASAPAAARAPARRGARRRAWPAPGWPRARISASARASMRQHGIDDLCSRRAGRARAPRRQGSPWRAWSAASPCRRGTARLLPISASASTARSLTHQSVSRVASIRLSTARSSFVWLRISMAARRMSSSLSRTSCSTASMTFGPPILPSASAARLRTHQSLSLMRLEQVLHRVRVADLVQHLDRGAAGVLVLVLQHLDQVLDGLGMVGLDDDVDGLVLHVDLGIAQQRAQPLHVDGAVHALQRGERRRRGSACSGPSAAAAARAAPRGLLKRARMLMMCTRAIGSLPRMRPISSGRALSSAISPMMRNRAAFSLASCW